MPERAPEDEDEAALVAAARGGSRPALARLVRRHQASVRGYIGGHIRDPMAADDLAQDTFVSALRGLATFRGDSSLRTWLLGIAHHRILDHLRIELRATERASLAGVLLERELELLEPTVERLGRRDSELAALRRCLDRLTGRSAALVTDHYLGARSLVELARDTDRREGTLRVELLRARRALRRCIEATLAAEART